MIIKNEFLFAPGTLLKDLNGKNVISAFRDRIEQWYFEPIKMMNKKELGFAATALIASVIDILAKTSKHDLTNNKNEEKYTKWIREEFNFTETEASQFYKHFRCGLLHSGCIEFGGYVNYKISNFYQGYKKSLIINPNLFFNELKDIFYNFIEVEKPDELLNYLKGKLDEIK